MQKGLEKLFVAYSSGFRPALLVWFWKTVSVNAVADVVLPKDNVKSHIAIGAHQVLKVFVVVAICRGVALCKLAKELRELQVMLPRTKDVDLKGCFERWRPIPRIPKTIATKIFPGD